MAQKSDITVETATAGNNTKPNPPSPKSRLAMLKRTKKASNASSDPFRFQNNGISYKEQGLTIDWTPAWGAPTSPSHAPRPQYPDFRFPTDFSDTNPFASAFGGSGAAPGAPPPLPAADPAHSQYRDPFAVSVPAASSTIDWNGTGMGGTKENMAPQQQQLQQPLHHASTFANFGD
ncbi:hypothetical protein CAEBREN_32125, partial [Caenorhabditis brenneri]